MTLGHGSCVRPRLTSLGGWILLTISAPLTAALSLDDIRGLSNRELCAHVRPGQAEEAEVADELSKRQLSCDENSLSQSGIDYTPQPRTRVEPSPTATAEPGAQPAPTLATTPTPPVTNPLTSVVRISAESSIGSGFYVAPNRIVTNAHVLKEQPIVTLSFSKGASFRGTVIYRNSDLDFAIIQPEVTGNPLVIREEPVKRGEPVVALGYPQGRQVIAISTGTVTEILECCLEHDALIAGGSSGGPLLDARNQVLGLNALISQRPGDIANETERSITLRMDYIVRSLRGKSMSGEVQELVMGKLVRFNENVARIGRDTVRIRPMEVMGWRPMPSQATFIFSACDYEDPMTFWLSRFRNIALRALG